MAETFHEYRARVLGYLGSRDPMRVLATTPRKLKRLTDGSPRAVLVRRPAPGKWSTVEIAAHLADAELAFGWRVRNMVATPGVPLQWWDEHLWSETFRYSTVPLRLSLTGFTAMRRANLALLRSVPRSSYRTAIGLHQKRGRQTLHDFVVMEAAHDLNHLHQIRNLLKS
jgi:hypothetical protein